jgi:hypothetical protein
MLEESPAVSMTVLKLSHHHQQLSAAKDKNNSVVVTTGGGGVGGISSATTAKMDSMMQLDSGDETNTMATAGGVVKVGVQPPSQPPPTNHQQQTASSRPSHISFSVAALLADTRPSPRHRSSPSFLTSQSPPLEPSTPYRSEHPLTSSDDELNDDDSEQGSAVDVEVLRDSNSPVITPTPVTPPPVHQGGSSADMLSARFMLAGGHGPGAGMVTPVRPTPFSALAAAAAAYSAGLQHHHHASHHQHNSWATSTLVGHYPGAMFPGPAAAAAAFAAAGLGGSPGKRDCSQPCTAPRNTATKQLVDVGRSKDN